MTGRDLLRQLDDRLLPVLARRARQLGDWTHRARRARLLTMLALLSAAAVVLAATWATDRPAGGDPTVGQVVRVGVAGGESIPAYVQGTRDELASLMRAEPAADPSATTYALVTLSRYVTPADLAPVLQGLSVAEVLGRVPLRDTQTEIVRLAAQRLPADAEAAMDAVADGKDREALTYQARGSAVTGDGRREAELRRLYETGVAVARAEAAAFRARCACLYAAVVRGTPTALAAVTRRSAVRAVDPAPEVDRLERAVLLPPLPEQTDVVRPPADTALAGEPPAGSRRPAPFRSAAAPSCSPVAPSCSPAPSRLPAASGEPVVATPLG